MRNNLFNTTMHLIQEVFGEDCDLYETVLKCSRDADKAQLRKAYYRTALVYHPDKNPGNDLASRQFQAVSLAYQILQDPDLRTAYDETGEIPDTDPNEADNDDAENKGMEQWKNYFAQIFGKVTSSKIDAFASKYKCSDEEKKDVLSEFKKRKGNLVKMLEFVMLSEPRDALRWVEDYLRPAMEKGEVDSSFRGTMEKTLEKLKKKAEKDEPEEEEEGSAEEMEDAEETDTEEELPVRSSRSGKKQTKVVSPKKAKPTQTKRKKPPTGMQDLISQIQNKNRTGGDSLWNDLGARYGVPMEDDPLQDDQEFVKAQAKLKKKSRKKA